MIEVRCPYCNALQFKAETLPPETELEIKCRGRNCGRILKISIAAQITVTAVSSLPEAYKPVETK